MTAAVALAVVAVVLAWPVPRVMARLTTFRREPLAALVVWQAVTLSAVLCALAAAPAAALALTVGRDRTGYHLVALVLAGVVTGGILVRLLWSGHRVGTRLRGLRRRHRDLVDLVGTRAPTSRRHGPHVRVLEHPTPTAYCLPGVRKRVVLTQGTIEVLPADELEAVLAHERAHLRARHDLVLEFFTVGHEAVPLPVRCDAALREVRLLVEALADRAAARHVGRVATARALVALAGGSAPEAALGAGDATTAAVRLELLRDESPHLLLRFVMYACAVGLLAIPVALLTTALLGA